jgi:multiple sugar transport system substrate-binding protein
MIVYKYLIVMMLCAILLSCGHKVDQEIVFWHALGGPLGDALNEMIYDFNREHPDIRIKAISMGNYQALSQKLMASIQAGNQPDISQVFESWTANLINGNALIALDDFIQEDPEFLASLDDIFPVFILSNTFDGKIWSFPFNKSVRVMYYNKDIFFRHGLDHESPPRTWDEYIDLCRLFTNGDNAGRGQIFGTTFGTDMWRFQNLLLQAGGNLMNEDNTLATFDGSEGVEALQFFDTLLNVDRSAYLSAGHDGQNHFLAEKVAFVEGSSVSYVFMKNAEITFNLGIAAIPTFRTQRNIISGTNIAIFDKGDPEKSKAAWKFIKWFTEPKQTAKFSALTYYMPIRKSAFDEPHVQNMLAEHPGLNDVFRQLDFAEFEPQIPQWFEFRKNFEEIVLERVFLRTLTPEVALRQAAQRLQNDIQRSRQSEL